MSKIYSPNQIAIGTFLGGPLAAIFFLKRNFDTLGKEELSKQTLKIGLVVSLIIIAILPYLPEATPSILIPMLYLFPTIMVVKTFQISKDEIMNAEEYSFQSSWKVFGISLGWMLVFLVASILFMFLLESVGMLNLDDLS